MNSFGAICRVD